MLTKYEPLLTSLVCDKNCSTKIKKPCRLRFLVANTDIMLIRHEWSWRLMSWYYGWWIVDYQFLLSEIETNSATFLLNFISRSKYLFSGKVRREMKRKHEKNPLKLKSEISPCNGCSPCVSQRKFDTAQFVLSGHKICPDTSFTQFAFVTVYPLCCTYSCIS